MGTWAYLLALLWQEPEADFVLAYLNHAFVINVLLFCVFLVAWILTGIVFASAMRTPEDKKVDGIGCLIKGFVMIFIVRALSIPVSLVAVQTWGQGWQFLPPVVILIVYLLIEMYSLLTIIVMNSSYGKARGIQLPALHAILLAGLAIL